MRTLVALVMFFSLAVAQAEERKIEKVEPTEVNIRKAVDRAIPQLWKGMEGHNEKHTCFTCHNHGAALVAFGIAKAKGYDIPEKKLQEQIDFLVADLERNKPRYEKGQGPGPSPAGGQTDNTGSLLFALDALGCKPDASTAAVVSYTLAHQKEREFWKTSGTRAPTEASSFTTTALNIRGIRAYRTKEQTELADKRIGDAKEWLLKTAAKENEDRVFRLIGLKAAGANADELKKAAEELLKSQRDDGGWSQLDTMTSDPYATATALYALQSAGGIAADSPAVQKGLRYLLGTQGEDGTWFVKTRSKPVQKYFESGFPHGKDQFISCAATGWATTALALATPVKK